MKKNRRAIKKVLIIKFGCLFIFVEEYSIYDTLKV
jgi:hypothetical protein